MFRSINKNKRNKKSVLKVLTASSIIGYIDAKYEMYDEQFWDWLTSHTEWGDSVELSVHPKDIKIIKKANPKFIDYLNVIVVDYSCYADNNYILEIKNDY